MREMTPQRWINLKTERGKKETKSERERVSERAKERLAKRKLKKEKQGGGERVIRRGRERETERDSCFSFLHVTSLHVQNRTMHT